MRPRVLLVVAPLVLLAASLTGCTGSTPAPQAPAGAGKEASQAGLVSASEASNVTSQESAPSEFAKALEQKFHTHDYWNGLLEKTLMDEDVVSAALIPESPSGPFGTIANLVFRATPFGGGFGTTPFLLPEGSIVPPEASRVEATVTWTQSNTITGLQFGYQSIGSRTQRLDPFPEGGGMVSIETNLTQNDMPHTSVSKWNFWLFPHAAQGPAVFNGTAHVLIKAFRNDTLYVAPPHPDLWGDNTTKLLFDGGGHLKGTRAVLPVFDPSSSGNEGFAQVQLDNGTLIAPHTALLTVTMTYTNNASTPNPFNIHPEFYYRAANTRGQHIGEVSSAEAGKVVYTITVDGRMADSPYANHTSWGFQVALDSDAPTDQNGFLGDIGDYDGDFHVTIVAEREANPE